MLQRHVVGAPTGLGIAAKEAGEVDLQLAARGRSARPNVASIFRTQGARVKVANHLPAVSELVKEL